MVDHAKGEFTPTQSPVKQLPGVTPLHLNHPSAELSKKAQALSKLLHSQLCTTECRHIRCAFVLQLIASKVGATLPEVIVPVKTMVDSVRMGM
ncbi:hypothetical protein DYB26_013362 [Aphanomyces astaci]|uniref:Uncharacterized protein n=1 Tax=Aphanomyces astaci TaxID=112090 RepID=A0A3R7C7I6_APHAT|nr:hypothetical protein DYB26_013362 [Aphanomyces astaci]